MINVKGNKKGVGDTFCRLSRTQALALPSLKISNSASPRHRVLYKLMYRANDGYHTLGYNTPSMNASLRLPSERIKCARLFSKNIITLIYSELQQIKFASDEKKNEKKERNISSMKKLNYPNAVTLNFNLREPYGNKATNIYAVIKINGKQIKIPLGLKINSWNWDKFKQIPIINSNMAEEDKENALEVLNKIYKINFGFQKYFSHTCNNFPLTESNIKEYFVNNLIKENMTNIQNLKNGNGRKPKATTLLKKAFKIYYTEMHTKIKESSIKINEIRLNAYFEYCNNKGKDALSMLTQVGVNEYQNYLIKKSKQESKEGKKRYDSSKSINYKCELIERLINKVMVSNSAFLRYHILPVKYNQLEEVNQKGEEKKRRPLKEEEINKLINCADLDGEEEEYRDLFLLECYGSYRISDTPKLFIEEERKTFKKGDYEFIVINTKKENTTSVIWVNNIIKEILDKYKNGFTYANPLSKNFASRYNILIKKIAKKANLNSVETYINAHNQKEEKYLYEIIASHFARYTFIYNGLFKFGFTPNELKNFTGHKDDRMINDCYKVETAEDKVNNAFKAISRVLNKKSESRERISITRENINEQDSLIKEIKEALYCLGADYNELVDINDYHKLNEILYCDYHNKYKELGCDVDYIKELYLNKDIISLKEKREMILKLVDEVKCKKNIFLLKKENKRFFLTLYNSKRCIYKGLCTINYV